METDELTELIADYHAARAEFYHACDCAGDFGLSRTERARWRKRARTTGRKMGRLKAELKRRGAYHLAHALLYRVAA